MKNTLLLFASHFRNRKHSVCLFIYSLCLFFSPNDLMAQSVFKMPRISGMTLEGKSIDSTYFLNKVTLISFFYIGCAPCMKEIPVLNKLKEHFKNSNFQILGIAPHTPSQLLKFNSPDATNKSDSASKKIEYDLLPECPEDGLTGMSTRCHTLSQRFGVSAYPTSVMINGKEEILMTTEGFPMREKDEETLKEMIRMVEQYMNNNK